MCKQVFQFLLVGVVAVFLSPVVWAGGSTTPANYPANAAGAKEFNWQKEWGSLHLNSFADGVGDPGAPTSVSGTMPCDNKMKKLGTDSICNTISPADAAWQTFKMTNAIKYDIKRSVAGCLSKAVPNWSYNNVWDSDVNSNGPCTLTPGLHSISNEDDASGGTKKFIHDYTGPDTKWRQSQKDLATSIRGNDGKKVLEYLPVYDARSNDDRSWLVNHFVGCQQQIANNCANDDKGHLIRDMHDCISSPSGAATTDSPGYKHPVSHTFTPEEVKDLKSSMGLTDSDSIALPTVYFTYRSKHGSEDERTALSAVDPREDATKFPDMVAGSAVEKIDTSDPTDTADHFLSNLKSYRFSVTEGDLETFVVMDPSDFFDLSLYIKGGKYDSGYNQFNPDTKAVETFNTCPVNGLTNGYGGICDPEGKAGCNLPIYGQGEPTTFKDAQNNEYTYNAYPLKWSGYVKQWALITRDQYLKNICGSSGCSPHNKSDLDREDYYIVSSEEGLNDNPIFMITRSDDYCENSERTSNPRAQLKAGNVLTPDMPCIQYLQYEDWTDENKVKQWSFVDLFNPVEAAFDTIPPEYNSVHLFNLDKNGDPDYSSPVEGSGPPRFIAEISKATGHTVDPSKGYVRLLDAPDPKGGLDASGKPVPFIDGSGAPTKLAKYCKEPTVTGGCASLDSAVVRHADPVANSKGDETTGDMADKDHPEKGAKLEVSPGTASAVRMPQQVNVKDEDGVMKQSSCVVVGFTPMKDATLGAIPKRTLFVPTNSPEEFQAFVTAMQADKKPVDGFLLDCSTNFQHKSQSNRQLAFEKEVNPNKSTDAWRDYSDPAHPEGIKQAEFSTWTGTLQCADLSGRPACNQVKMISAQRRCQLENGAIGRCGDCAKTAKRPDLDDPSRTKFDFENELVGGAVQTSPATNDNDCYFSATCFAKSTEGCPDANVPGGHVFCLAPETKISMADGTEKPIKDIKAGDEVVAFNAKQSRSGAMGKAVVKATAITKKQEIVQINNLKITPLHKVVLATGRAVMAKEIKVGDKILMGTGEIEVVKKVKSNLKKITVYNLVLEKESDGYIAGGIRVMSYPLMKEMEVISGHASAKKAKGRAPASVKKVSSLKSE